jgi:demethylmenaquinone methyltransferase/2-methoxy-6-polyprenyl-1,4-benzoquinol methylase
VQIGNELAKSPEEPETKPDAVEASAPHPPLLGYYAAPQERDGFVRDLFNRTAPSYDRINRILSLGSGAWYRGRTLRRAGLRPGARMLDVAVGTGLLAREAVRITGSPADVIGLDLSEGMLAEARRGLPIPLIQARAEALPIADGSLDFVSMGYALRHVPDLAAVFAEYRRVLRPGGRLLLLEMGKPASRAGYAAAKLYLGRAIPALSRLTGRGGDTLMQYYWDTIDACVPPETIQRLLAEAGFEAVACETELGIFRAYMAVRPGADSAQESGAESAQESGAEGAEAPGAAQAQQPPEFDALVDQVVARHASATRFGQGFVRGKLRRDPATRAVLDLARRGGGFGEVVDLGCGRGQLGLALLLAGLADRVTGLDLDLVKLDAAWHASAGLQASYAMADLATAEIPACDTALLIDVLLQMPPVAQRAVLARVARAARRRVVIRAFDPDRGWRSRFGMGMERLGRRIRRDGVAIAPMPLRELAAPFEAAGFTVTTTPCWQGTPLPNVLLVAERAAP